MYKTDQTADVFYENLIGVLQAVVQQEPSGRFEFSCYINGAPGTAGTRTFICANAIDLSANWIVNAIKKLPRDTELALNSRYYVKKRVLHIPMIDFLGGDAADLELQHFKRLGLNSKCPWLLANSGNSFHAYFGTLLSNRDWLSYLGCLLLQTPPTHNGKPMPIDVRWIGHSLINGFTALRCSGRTSRYKQIPRFVTRAESLESTTIDVNSLQSHPGVHEH